MVTSISQLVPIQILPGVQPSSDRTPFSTQHFTFADKIRFFQGVPQKIGGWASSVFNYGATILGTCRSIFSAIVGQQLYTLIGTNTTLYALIGSSLTNITPLNTSTTGIPNSLATDFRTLGANPLTFTNGAGTISIADANASHYQVNDTITLSGLSGTIRGIASAAINGPQVIRSIVAGVSYSISVAGTATSSGTGGGAGVGIASGLVTVSAVAHGMSNGQRTKIAGAVGFGGILAVEINIEAIVRNALTNSFAVMTVGTATSAVTADGGAGTTFRTQLAAGAKDQSAAQGYGAGLYGAGLYGTALVSATGITYPRIWFFDRFEGVLIMTPGNQGGLYEWTPNTSVAPAQLSGAPDDINYAFVSNDIVVTFGHGNIPNRIFASDQGNPTQWVGSSTNQVFDDTIAGADQLTSHVNVNGVNLIFTPTRAYTFAYIGLPLVWDIALLDGSIGIIAPMARCVALGVAYWMGPKNFYMWAGGNVQVVPSADQFVATILNYVYKNLSAGQRSKIFCWFNKQFNEIWFHYPSAGANEPDRVARFNVLEQHWAPDTFDRTAAEYPDQLAQNPRLVSSSSILYQHETGNDADGAAMPFRLTSNLRGGSKENSFISSYLPDSVQTGDITVTLTAQQFTQSSAVTTQQITAVSPSTEFVPAEVQGRFWRYDIEGNVIGQSWIGGQWMENVQKGAPQ